MPIRIKNARKSVFHKILAVVALLVVAVSVVIATFVTRADELEDGVEVEKNSELTYYLHVKYDGVDVFGTESSNEATAEVLSDRIKVTDTLPKGLTFNQFVTSTDGTFGAAARGNSAVACAGHVIDDTNEVAPANGDDTYNGTWDSDHKNFHYHGLHYNDTTREVSFYVERLKAGCELVVGISTQTPATVDDPETTAVETRRDFYNTANATEGLINARSNTVHVFMGDLTAVQHQVTYSYTGTVPAGAPAVPVAENYAEGASVSVAANPMLDGYTFSGWTSATVTPTNGLFDMPGSDVAFVGNWTASTVVKYDVIYEVAAADGSTLPSWAVAPKTKSYEPGTEVAVDSTESKSEGEYINYDGYRFSGWKMKDTVTSTVFPIMGDDAGTGFVMPSADVHIIGYYERIYYTVSYEFEGTILPPNADSLLPAPTTHYPGDTVTTAAGPTAAGYRFLGWYKADTFKMPESDVVILGEWGIQNGEFTPTIKKYNVYDNNTIVPNSDTEHSYIYGDTAKFKTIVCNTASFALHEVIIQEQLDGAVFTTDGAFVADSMSAAETATTGAALDVTLSADSIIKINSLAANKCGVVYSTYVIKTTAAETKTNTVEMIGALADNYYILADGDYTATDDFDIEAYNEPEPFTGINFKNTTIFIGLVVIAIIGGSVIVLSRKKA